MSHHKRRRRSLNFRGDPCGIREAARFPGWAWFLVGVAIVLAIAWWLKR